MRKAKVGPRAHRSLYGYDSAENLCTSVCTNTGGATMQHAALSSGFVCANQCGRERENVEGVPPYQQGCKTLLSYVNVPHSTAA